MPEESNSGEVSALLREIRDNQRIQLENQVEALRLQNEVADLMRRQSERTAQIQDRAEAVQERGRLLVSGAQRAVRLTLIVVTVLLIILVWLMLGYRLR